MVEDENERRRRLKREYQRQYYANNKDKANEATKRWRENNAERVSEKAQIRAKEWKARNPHRVAENAARRRAKKKSQTPHDANREAIAAIYAMAETLTRINGVPYHVDHIKPLAEGGLHHEDNLVVMRGDLNIKKATEHWPWLTWFNG